MSKWFHARIWKTGPNEWSFSLGGGWVILACILLPIALGFLIGRYLFL